MTETNAQRKFRVSLEGELTSESGDQRDSIVKALYAAIQELDGLTPRSAAIDLDHASGYVYISCCVHAPHSEDALSLASASIRAALHSAQIGTENWPGPTAPNWKIEFVGTSTKVLASA